MNAHKHKSPVLTVATHKRINRILYRVVIILVVVVLGYIFIKNLGESLFFTHRDRINVVIYGKDTSYFSLGIDDNVNYMMPFYNDLRIMIPGGYGYYRVGAIGKLATLEGKPIIFRNAFSSATSTLVDFYFYPKTTDLYYGKKEPEDVVEPTTNEILFTHSNANFFDKLFLALLFSQRREREFKILSNLKITEKSGDDLLREDELTKNYLGFFYSKMYRNEKENVQIIYSNSYKTADRIGKTLEGSGIRVSDISYSQTESKTCKILEDSQQFSLTALQISKFFGCRLDHGKTDIYDILFIVGDKEKEWEVD